MTTAAQKKQTQSANFNSHSTTSTHVKLHSGAHIHLPVGNKLASKGCAPLHRRGDCLAILAWQIVYTALWNTKEFSGTEKEQAINLICLMLQKENNAKKAFNSFVQRVLLARQYINTHPGTHPPIPTLWLCSDNKNGFAATQKWLAAVQNIRSSIPGYKQPLKAFAEAIHETATSNSSTDFHYWRSYFIQQDAQGLLNLFLSTIANISHTNDCHLEALGTS